MKIRYWIGAFFLLCIAAAVVFFLRTSTISVLNPQGPIAGSERSLIIHAVELMLIVIVPVLFLLFFFAWHYRASNTRAKYLPNWEHSKMDELVWWAIPFEIVLVLGALTWGSTHELDPHKPITSLEKPLVIEVVALPWKWLFIYPEQNIATTNFVELPTNRPVKFEVTADAPMNSFWIPQLGGQIYAMTGMINPLYLQADTVGEYEGLSANYSGDGFAQMHFITKAVSKEEFSRWIISVQATSHTLTMDKYQTLRQPSTTTPTLYSWVQPNLYTQIVMQFMDTTNPGAHMH